LLNYYIVRLPLTDRLVTLAYKEWRDASNENCRHLGACV
jgi:hypothetical protein